MAFPRGEVYAAFCTAGSTRPCKEEPCASSPKKSSSLPSISTSRTASATCAMCSGCRIWPSTTPLSRAGAWTATKRKGTAGSSASIPSPTNAAATWVAELASRQSLRRYLFWRAADRSVLAEAATVWVYINMATGRPSRLPASLQSAFEVVADDKEVLQLLQD